MASNKTDLCVNDIVRVVKRSGRGWRLFGETPYVIREMNYEPTGYRCMISQYEHGKVYASQEFDISLLERVDRIKDNQIQE